MSQPLPGFDAGYEVGATVNLTERQAFALACIAEHAPLTSVELGARLCERRSKHGHDVVCEWCQPSGAEVGRALKRKGLVRKTRAGWVPEGWEQVHGPSSQLGPADPWPAGF